MPNDLPGMLAAILNQAIHREPVPAWQSVLVLVIVSALAMVLGVWLLKSREIEK